MIHRLPSKPPNNPREQVVFNGGVVGAPARNTKTALLAWTVSQCSVSLLLEASWTDISSLPLWSHTAHTDSHKNRWRACATSFSRVETLNDLHDSYGAFQPASRSRRTKACSRLEHLLLSTRETSRSSTASSRATTSPLNLIHACSSYGYKPTTSRQKGCEASPWELLESTGSAESSLCPGQSGMERRQATALRRSLESSWGSGTSRTPTLVQGRSDS